MSRIFDFSPLFALAGAAAILALACLYFWFSRLRYRRQVIELHDEVANVASNAAFGKRIPTGGSDPELSELADTINHLFDALHDKDKQMRQREALFQDLANTMPEVVIVHRERIIFANQIAADLLGVSPDQLVGQQVTDLVRPAYRAIARTAISRQLGSNNQMPSYELQLIDGQERGRWTEATGTSIEYRGEKVILTVARDITYRKSIEATLSKGKRQAQITLESIGEGVITTNTKGVIDYMNTAAEHLAGTTRASAIGRQLSDIAKLVDESDRRDLGDPVSKSLVQRRRVNLGRGALLVSKDGKKEVSIELTASPIVAPDASVAGTVIILRDVSEMRGLTREMSYQAAHDALTGLINRREFERQLDLALQASRSEGVSHVLCYLDLDRFKAVNDSVGHLAGDTMLREIAALAKKEVRESDFVGRLGGDEFGTLLVGCPLDKSRQIAADICNAVTDYRFVWKDKIFNIGISVGLVEISHASGNLQDTMSAADSACYVAKQRGRGQVHVYSARDEAIARERGDIQWLRQLQDALHEGKFELAMQPIIATSGGDDRGPAAEVFIRLPDDRGRFADTAEFLRPAERYQLMPQIDRWVVNATLAAINSGKIKLAGKRSCAINISGQTLGDEGFLGFVVESLDRSGVAPDKICFEVNEGAVTSNVQHAQRFIEVLHGIGCEFALDDFGSGLGAFSNLKNLPVDYLKIDGSYTRNLSSDQINQEMVSAMIKLARTMEFRVVAEQVEQQEDFDWLRNVGVDFVQGNFIEAPSPLGSSTSGTHRTT
jgi:diguanylate cyclase (GGDEF)-like protein/PAS domain S-box-containing protein